MRQSSVNACHQKVSLPCTGALKSFSITPAIQKSFIAKAIHNPFGYQRMPFQDTADVTA
jgi:hypothetical protein